MEPAGPTTTVRGARPLPRARLRGARYLGVELGRGHGGPSADAPHLGGGRSSRGCRPRGGTGGGRGAGEAPGRAGQGGPSWRASGRARAGRGGARQALAAGGRLTVITSRAWRPREPEARARGLRVATAAASVCPAACSAHTALAASSVCSAAPPPQRPGLRSLLCLPSGARCSRRRRLRPVHCGSGRRLRSSAATAVAPGSLGLTLPPIGGGHRASSAHAADVPNLLWRSVSPVCANVGQCGGASVKSVRVARATSRLLLLVLLFVGRGLEIGEGSGRPLCEPVTPEETCSHQGGETATPGI